MHLRLSVLMSISLCASACVDDGEPSTSLEEGLSTCPAMGCGSNSPEMGNGISFHELDLNGAANDVGVTIGSFGFPSQPAMTLMVDGHHLRGRRPNNTIAHWGALVGAELRLHHASGDYLLHIAEVNETAFWFGATS